MKYALLNYSTANIGDEIQSIAASRFLPNIDFYLDRDDIDSSELPEQTKLIMNGWYSHRPELWPPKSKNIRPLMVSFHIADDLGSSAERMLSVEALEFYEKNGPVGTRDIYTYEILKAAGVACYFSGCLTLTLISKIEERTEDVLLVDLSSELIKVLPENFRKYSVQQYRLWHGSQSPFDPANVVSRFHYAQSLLDRYAEAKLVITSRLHCALPCVAFGTPVVFLPKDKNDVRFGGLLHLFDHVYSQEEFLSGEVDIPWDDLKPKGRIDDVIPKKLVSSCRAFTGYDKFANI